MTENFYSYENDEKFMHEALSMAQEAMEHMEIPIGAVIVQNNKIIGRGRNKRKECSSPLAHAEIEALNDAAKYIDNWRFDDATIYVTLEPCVMCAAALVQARIKRIVFGASDAKGGGCGSLYNIPKDERFYHTCQITSGVLEEDARKILQKFFKQKRSAVK
ncbi:MAG: tRNA adenosine(34) deaminase TadA [Synergistaceae bacterium]|nr:tRNA adenosine(34) deaminase TadA [Synergistaceae bacterium]